MANEIKLGIVGEAMLAKIKQKNKLLTKEEQEYLASIGYVPRGTGYAKVDTNKFVSDKEISEKMSEFRGEQAVPVAEKKGSDPVYTVIKSIRDSIITFTDLIIERGETKIEDLQPKDAEPAEKVAVPKADELPIFKKFKALLALGTTVLLQAAYPIYEFLKPTFIRLGIFFDRLKGIFLDGVLPFFTHTIPNFFEDIKDFFVVSIPRYFNDFIDTAKNALQSLMDVPQRIINSLQDFGLNFADSILSKFSPWFKMLGINTDKIATEIKAREKLVKERELALNKAKAARDAELERKRKASDAAQKKLDDEKAAVRAREQAILDEAKRKRDVERLAAEAVAEEKIAAAERPAVPAPPAAAKPPPPPPAAAAPSPAPTPPAAAAPAQPSTMTGALGRLMNLIAGKESRGLYDIVYGGKRIPEIIRMPIAQVLALQKNARNDPRFGRGSSAAGKYQMMPPVIAEEAKNLGLNIQAEPFSPENQDKMIINRMKRYRKFDKFMSGAISVIEFGKNLAMEFASFPVLAKTKGQSKVVERGQSFYAGDSLNKSLISANEVESILSELKGTPVSSSEQTGDKVQSATKAANVTPKQKEKQNPNPAKAPSGNPENKKAVGGKDSVPSPAAVTNQYKGYFAVS